METGFAVTAFLSLILNLVLPEEIEDEVVEITADKTDDNADREEWERIRRPSQIRAARKSADVNGEGKNSIGGSTSDDVEKGTMRMDGVRMDVGKAA